MKTAISAQLPSQIALDAARLVLGSGGCHLAPSVAVETLRRKKNLCCQRASVRLGNAWVRRVAVTLALRKARRVYLHAANVLDGSRRLTTRATKNRYCLRDASPNQIGAHLLAARAIVDAFSHFARLELDDETERLFFESRLLRRRGQSQDVPALTQKQAQALWTDILKRALARVRKQLRHGPICQELLEDLLRCRNLRRFRGRLVELLRSVACLKDGQVNKAARLAFAA